MRQEENKMQKRRFWVKKIFTEERKERRKWENRELSNDDREYYYPKCDSIRKQEANKKGILH